jgi:hypothetical protein
MSSDVTIDSKLIHFVSRGGPHSSPFQAVFRGVFFFFDGRLRFCLVKVMVAVAEFAQPCCCHAGGAPTYFEKH